MIDKNRLRRITGVLQYEAVLYRGDQIIDRTVIDEPSHELAEYLFFGEFGHKRSEGGYIIIEEM